MLSKSEVSKPRFHCIKLPCQFPLVKLGKDLVVELLVNIVDGTRLVRLVPQGLLEKLKIYKGKVAGFVVILCAKASTITNVFSSYKSPRDL